jgi:S1-C subfamily serine protease
LFIIERDWQKWVLDKTVPSSEHRTRQDRLGLEIQRVAQGAKIVGLQDGSAAKTAGRLKVGDIIEQFNGRAIRNEADLIVAIRSAGAMQTVKIQLMRNSRPMTVMQPLGEP